MKHFTLLLIAGVLGCSTAFAKGKDKEAAPSRTDALSFQGGGSFSKPKALKTMPGLAIAQYNVNFKQATTVSATKRETKVGGFGRVQGKAATGSVTAYLETSDGELTQADFQEIADHGYNYFQSALKTAGFPEIAWSKIAATDLYKEDGKPEEEEDRDQEQNRGQWWTNVSANHGSTILKRNAIGGFAFGKAKRAARLADEVGGTGAYLNLTVDFADIAVDVDVKTTGYKSTWTPSWNSIGQTTKMSSKTSVAPTMKVAANGGNSVLYAANNLVESVMLVQDIPAEMDYHTGISEDPDRATKRSKLFSVSFSKKLESTPVVITTTRDKYKAAAKRALEQYADTWIEKIKESRS